MNEFQDYRNFFFLFFLSGRLPQQQKTRIFGEIPMRNHLSKEILQICAIFAEATNGSMKKAGTQKITVLKNFSLPSPPAQKTTYNPKKLHKRVKKSHE